MWHCTAYRVYINPTALGFWGRTYFVQKNPLAATPSPLLYILTALLSPLFMSKELDVDLMQGKGMVMPGTEGCRTSLTGCCSNFRKTFEDLPNQI